jgi:PTS system N-acetylgalactosamine-specific IIA component
MMSDRAGVVAAHGGLAQAFIEAVTLITGRGDRLVPVTNRDLDAGGVFAALRTAVIESKAEVIFTDLPAGSCTMAARRVQREFPHVDIVAGVSLPLLLDFVLNNSAPPPASEHLAVRAREHLLVWEGTRVD